MPECGSQCILCDLPIRFDTYEGCSHNCNYCFARRKTKLEEIKKHEGPKSLENFVKGQRNLETTWCDWKIPIHWGGLSDPFQPCEKKIRNSYQCLKIFAETQYPFVVSTKGYLIADPEYLGLLSKCNCVVQISMACSSYDELEKGTPTFEERLAIVKKISPHVKRVNIRIQPYLHECFSEIRDNIKRMAAAGAYGIIVEGMKFQEKKPGLVKVGGDCVYPYTLIKSDFLLLKDEAHKCGLKIYAGENRIRRYGDSLTCCGVDGLDGFTANTFNLNHLLNGEKATPTQQMQRQRTGGPFKGIPQDTERGSILRDQSFAYDMISYYKGHKKHVETIFGVTDRKKGK